MSDATFEIGDRVWPRSGGHEGTVVDKHPDPERNLLLVESVILHSADTVWRMWRSDMGSVGEQRYDWYLPSELNAGWLFSHEEPDWWMVPRCLAEHPDLREYSKDKPGIPWDEIFRDRSLPHHLPPWGIW